MKANSSIRRIVDYFKDKDEVNAVYIFGSAACGRQTKASDIDIAVLVDVAKLKKKSFNALRNKYYIDSPHLSMRPLDIVILNTAPPFLKHRIIKTGKVIFGRDKKKRVRFAADAILEYLDYKPIEDICLKAVANRFKEATVGR